LFSEVGYSATTTRQIADAVALRQGSLFHYFARKDDMLAELLDRNASPALEFAALLGNVDAPPEVKLFTLLRRDVANLCSGPYNFAALQLLPEAKLPRFDEFWVKRAKLRRRYLQLIRQGAADGTFVIDDAELATDIVLGMVESTIVWFERGGRHRAADVVDAISAAIMRTLGTAPRRLAKLARDSADLLTELS
jgi:AcrR family transcriptional regulator